MRLVPVTSSFSTAKSGVNMVAKISKISSPKEPTNDSEMILRLLVADTNRFASGESLVKRPIRVLLAR
jgi:hypothetical protein